MKKIICKFCGKDITEFWPRQHGTCDGKSCRAKLEKKRLAALRESQRKYRLRKKIQRGVRKCTICGNDIEIEQTLARKYCLNPKCEAEHKFRQYGEKKRKVREKYVPVEKLPEHPPILHPIPKEDFFCHADYERQQKAELAKVKRCMKCGKTFTNSMEHAHCQRCKGKNDSIARHSIVDVSGVSEKYAWNLNAG